MNEIPLPEKRRFFDVIFHDINHFLDRFLGERYIPKNNFSHKQKNNILSYLYQKNFLDLRKPQQRFYKETELTETMTKEEIQNFLNNLKEVENYNRVFLITSICECQKRVAQTGYIMGTLFTAFLWMTVFRNVGYVKKVPIALTLIHLGGQFGYYRVLDRTFDSLYPFFMNDVNEYYKVQSEKDEILKVSTNKDLEELIQKSLKELEKKEKN